MRVLIVIFIVAAVARATLQSLRKATPDECSEKGCSHDDRAARLRRSLVAPDSHHIYGRNWRNPQRPFHPPTTDEVKVDVKLAQKEKKDIEKSAKVRETRAGRCIFRDDDGCRVRIHSNRILVANWLTILNTASRCGRMDMPSTCHLYKDNIRCPLPIHGLSGLYIELIKMVGVEAKFEVVDRGPFGIHLDVMMHLNSSQELVDAYENTGTDVLAEQLRNFTRTSRESYRQYYLSRMDEDISFTDYRETQVINKMSQLIQKLDLRVANPEEDDLVLPERDSEKVPTTSSRRRKREQL